MLGVIGVGAIASAIVTGLSESQASCCAEVETCMQNAECVALEQCADACKGDQTCVKGCVTDHPNGKDDLLAVGRGEQAVELAVGDHQRRRRGDWDGDAVADIPPPSSSR